jgi:hypothetical protein
MSRLVGKIAKGKKPIGWFYDLCLGLGSSLLKRAWFFFGVQN